ncbi:hypothetical protein TNCV_3974761 [Trichonephila clavipes]|nr:hypothetical protein TNCV_3974761 [Trichonephila clavipes]
MEALSPCLETFQTLRSSLPLKTRRVEQLMHAKSVEAQSSHWCGEVGRRYALKRGQQQQRKLFYLSNARAWLLDHLTPSLLVPTDDVISRVFNESSSKGPSNADSFSALEKLWSGTNSNQSAVLLNYCC